MVPIRMNDTKYAGAISECAVERRVAGLRELLPRIVITNVGSEIFGGQDVVPAFEGQYLKQCQHAAMEGAKAEGIVVAEGEGPDDGVNIEVQQKQQPHVAQRRDSP